MYFPFQTRTGRSKKHGLLRFNFTNALGKTALALETSGLRRSGRLSLFTTAAFMLLLIGTPSVAVDVAEGEQNSCFIGNIYGGNKTRGLTTLLMSSCDRLPRPQPGTDGGGALVGAVQGRRLI